MSGRAEYERHAASAEEQPQAGDGVADSGEHHEHQPTEQTAPDDAESRVADAEARAAEAASDTDPVRDEEIADNEATALAASREPKELAAALMAAERERDSYLDALRRERAEFENFRKRATRERTEALDRGAENLISQLLGVLDDFERVLDAASESEDAQLVKGVEMVHAALRTALSGAGLEEVPGTGAEFDPNWHEAMMQVQPDEPVEHPVVVDVLRRGYQFKGRVLRPASVSVAQ